MSKVRRTDVLSAGIDLPSDIANSATALATAVTEGLSTMRMTDVSDPNSLLNRFRRRRDVRLRALIAEIFETHGAVRILDLGGTYDYWKRVGIDFLRAHGATVTILNLSEDLITGQNEAADILSNRIGNALDMPEYPDDSFELVHSNSVIEHVGDISDMVRFGSESRRVGKYYYAQTPYFWFPIDPHFYRVPFFHWYPKAVRARLLCTFPIAHCGRIQGVQASYDAVNSSRLLNRKRLRAAFPDAKLRFEKIFGMPKSMIAVRGVAQVVSQS
jgi:hypothetical protein